MPSGNFRSVGPRMPGRTYGYPGQRNGDRRGDGDHRDRDHFRRPYISFYSAGYPYAYGPSVWPGYPFASDYGDDYGDDSQYAQNPQYADNGSYDNGGYDTQPPQQWPAYGPYAPSAGASRSVSASGEDRAVTLIFKDGRPAEQIHNYVLTKNSIFVGDARGVTIPLDQIDLSATEKANRESGVDFHVPQSQN